MGQDCGSAPYFTSRGELLPAFQGFCNGYINLNHKFEVVQVYGDLALATTVSFGCEGDFVTPRGSAPMPNREIFVLVKKNGEWKIKSYMFTYDPASPIKPPVSVCPPEASLSADLSAPAVDAGVAAFYDALSAKDVEAAVGVFADDGVYVHTGHKTARGKVGLRVLFQGLVEHFERPVNASAVDVQVAGRHATSVIASRMGFRDSFFFVGGKIKYRMTTRAHSNDPSATKTVEATVLNGAQTTDPVQEKEAVERAVDVYFTGFVGLNPKGMQSAFWEDPIYMFDFNAARQVPFGCSMSQDCGSAPYFTSRGELLPAFQGFCNGYINLNHQFEVVQVYGDLALATTVSFGCEGIYVTPQGSAPMPNREIFVLVKKNAEWKIKSYMFTYDPASPIKPPVSVCPPKASLSADLLAPAVDAGVAAFYDALSARDVDAAVGVFADDGVYDHTGHKTA